MTDQPPFAAGLLALSLLAVSGSAATGQTLADTLSGCGGIPPSTTIDADPSSYRALLPTLLPGQRLLLAPGTYDQGLPITGLNGAPNQCIVVEGPASGPPAVFTARSCCNTVSLQDSSYVAIRNLELDGQDIPVDAVKAESPSSYAHHVTLENLYIHGHGADQQIVGINTKSIAWNWVIRRCRILGAGTGIYLGDSDGSAEFVNGLIENNLIVDTIGYNMQIKHQNGRDTGAGIPPSATTTIRHNVFSKANNASTGANARPNLLVGHWPLTGPGSTDYYQIYGNFFFQNPVEALFQGEGNVGFYSNVLLNDSDPGVPAMAIQPQNDVPKAIEVFRNTVVAASRGIRVSGGDPGFEQRVVGNAALAGLPIQAPFLDANIEDTYASAAAYLANPGGAVGSTLSLFPLAGTLTGPPMSTATVLALYEKDRDFEGRLRGDVFRGAYDAEGTGPAWPLALAVKPEFADLTLALSDMPDPVDPGATLTYTAQVVNGGPAPVPSSTLTITLPAGVSFLSASAGCSQAGGAVTCTLPALAPSGPAAQVTVQVGVPANASGTLACNASVSSAGPLDPSLSDNAAVVSTVVAASADLSLFQSDSADPVPQGAPFSYTLTVTNGGPSVATGVTLTDFLSQAVSFASASAGCVNASGVVTCALGTLAQSAAASVTIDVTANNYAGAVNSASVTGAEADPSASNNLSYETTVFDLGLSKELPHGSDERLSLEALPGPVAREELFRLKRAARTSWEVVVDGTSADVSGPGQAISLQRIGPDLTTVLQDAAPVGVGHSRSLPLFSSVPFDVIDELVRVRSTGCTTDCGPEDVYRIRAYDTTYRVPRFNNSASQVTVLVVENTSADAVTGTVWLWRGDGSLAASQGFSVAPRGVFTLNTSTVAPGTSGSITLNHDGRYGALSGKAVSVEPATGFTFDSPMLPRPR